MLNVPDKNLQEAAKLANDPANAGWCLRYDEKSVVKTEYKMGASRC